MSTFSSKRRARVIKVSDEDDDPGSRSSTPGEPVTSEGPLKASLSFKAGRNPIRQSGLRKATTPGEEVDSADKDASQPDDDDVEGPAVVRPNASRSSFSKFKKRQAPKSSKLSFGDDTRHVGDSGGDDGLRTPLFGRRTTESIASRKGLSNRGIPLRSLEDDDARPRYSKDHLNELRSSTPNIPQDVSTLQGGPDDMDLDPSELDGALVVDSSDTAPTGKPETIILTEAEIREKKERRARLAKEQGFLSVEDDDIDGTSSRKKKDDTRLIAEDEDMGEGFDDYVEDGGLSLGRRAEKERRRRERNQMAELITAAEGHSSDDSSESDAERRIAYEAAQSRAGLDGLKKPQKTPAQELLRLPPKITPLPSLSECLSRLQATLTSMESEIKAKSAQVDNLRIEQEEIGKRKTEVQALLDETGKKYQEAMGRGQITDEAAGTAGLGAELAGERGLESLGTTPRNPGLVDEG